MGEATWASYEILGPGTLNKLVGCIGKPIRTDKAIAQKDIMAYARIPVEVSIDKDFPTKIVFVNEKGVMQSQLVQYECKPINCEDCKGIGHTK